MYRAMLAAVLVATAIFPAASSAASPLASPNDLKQICQEVLDRLGRGDSEAFSLLREVNVNQTPQEDWKTAVATYRHLLESFAQKSGEYIGNELIEERKVNETFRKYVYLAKYEKNVVRWSFVFYRPRDQWKLLAFNFRQDLSALDELLK